MESLDDIKALISQGEIEQALACLDRMLEEDTVGKDQLYYLRGNAWRKRGDWQQALNNYQQAIDLNPESPARHARQMALDILEFYHKDMYNQ